MQSKKAIVVILVALMITGGMGYFLQPEHHTVEKLTYNYQGDTGPSIQYSQIDEWTEYNPLENVTGWDRGGAKVEVPVLSSGSNQYILSKSTYDYLEKPVTTKTYSYLSANAPTVDGSTPLSPYWVATGDGLVYGISSQGSGNNYPENWGEGDFHEVSCVGVFNKTQVGSNVKYTLTNTLIEDENHPENEVLSRVSGGYSQYVLREYHVGVYGYTAKNYLNFIFNINDGAIRVTSNESFPLYFVSLDTYRMDGLKSGDVVDLENLPNFGVVKSRANQFYWHIDADIHLSKTARVTQDITLNITTINPPSTKFIYESDSHLWYPAQSDSEGRYHPISGEKGYNASELGFYYLGEPTEGIQAYCQNHVPKYYSAVQNPTQFADPTQYVIVKDNKVGEWSNKETNGVIRLLASVETVVSVNDGKTTLSIPAIPYDYAYVTLDFLNKEFYCQGITYPKDTQGVPIITTQDYQLNEYRYPLTVSGEPLPDSVTGLGFFGQEKIAHNYLSVNLSSKVWYNTDLTGRNIPAMSIMYDNTINPLEFDREDSTDCVYNIVNADGIIGSMVVNKKTSVALVSYYKESYHAGTFRFTLDYAMKYLDSMTVGGEPYQLTLESEEIVSSTNYSQLYGIYKDDARVGHIKTSVEYRDHISISLKFDDILGGSGLVAPLSNKKYTLHSDHGTVILVSSMEWRGETSILPDQYERVIFNITSSTVSSALVDFKLTPFTIWFSDTLYNVTDGTIANGGKEFWYTVKIGDTVLGSLKIDATTGQSTLTLLSASGHEGVYTLTLDVPESVHYMAFNNTNGIWTNSRGFEMAQYDLIFDNTRYHCQPVREPDTDDYYFNVMPRGSTTVVGVLHPYYYGFVLEMTQTVGYAQRTFTYVIPLEWVEYPSSSLAAVNPSAVDWYCSEIDTVLAPFTAIYQGNVYQLDQRPDVTPLNSTVSYPLTYLGGGSEVGTYSIRYVVDGDTIKAYSTVSVGGSTSQTVLSNTYAQEIPVSYINPSHYYGTVDGVDMIAYSAVIDGIRYGCVPEEMGPGMYSLKLNGSRVGVVIMMGEWGGPSDLADVVLDSESRHERHFFIKVRTHPWGEGNWPRVAVNCTLRAYTMVADIPYTAEGTIGEAPKTEYFIVNLGSNTFTTYGGIRVEGYSIYDAGKVYHLEFESKTGSVEKYVLTQDPSPDPQGYLYVDDETFKGYVQYIGYPDSIEFQLEEGTFADVQTYKTGKVIQSNGYYGEEIIAKGVGCEVFVVSTVVSVDPLGILWGNPDMYLGYYFEEQMKKDTRLLFNAFVKTGTSITLNGQTFNITKDGYIEVPLGRNGEMIEQHMNGMALDFIDNHVYLTFTQDKDKTLDLGVLDNRPIVVPGSSKVMQQGFHVAAMGNWYWESGLYDIDTSEAEEYGFLINGSFGLDMSSAALLMIGIIIICTAIMLYINKEDEFSFIDWVIIGLAILLLLVLALIG